MGIRQFLTASVFIWSVCLTTEVFAQCKKIDAEVKIEPTSQADSQRKTITIDLKGLRKDNFTFSLFGPNKVNELHTEKTTFENLPKGKYLIVISAKREEYGYCPQSLNVTIN